MYKSDTLLVSIKLKEKLSQPEKLPNIFTPNGDGINDEFYIDNMLNETCEEQFKKVEIYNRWGSRIFSSNNINFRWNADGISDGLYYFNIFLGKQNINGYVVVARWENLLKAHDPEGEFGGWKIND